MTYDEEQEAQFALELDHDMREADFMEQLDQLRCKFHFSLAEVWYIIERYITWENRRQ